MTKAWVHGNFVILDIKVPKVKCIINHPPCSSFTLRLQALLADLGATLPELDRIKPKEAVAPKKR